MKKITKAALLMLITLFTLNFAHAQCPIPTGLSSITLSATSAKLNWTAPVGATSYNIEIENGQNNVTPFSVKANASSTTYTVSGLTGGFAFKFKVRTRCGGDKSNWSAWFTFVAGGGAINCGQLSGLSVTNITATGAKFNWNASAGGLGYALQIEDASGNPVNYLATATTTTNTYTKTGLNPSSNYKFKVRKRCAVGVNGPWSAWVSFTTASARMASSGDNTVTNETVSVFPNPASDYVEVVLNNTIDSRIQSYQFYDVTGKLMGSGNIAAENKDNSYTLPIWNLDNGIYQLILQTTNQSVAKKIVVSR